MPTKKPPRRTTLGKLPPMYKFILNPYQDARFTSCPRCEAKMRSRKLPFVVHVDPRQLVVLNMTARYCPDDDLLILHKDKLETLLAAAVAQSAPELIGNDYLVLGTLERSALRQIASSPFTFDAIFDAMHDFTEYLTVEPAHYGWVPTGSSKAKPAR